MTIGKTIAEHLGSQVQILSQRMQAALGCNAGLAEETLRHELAVAESHEAMRLIASAYRENLLESRRGHGFRVSDGEWSAFAWNVRTAVGLRSPAVPPGPKRIFLVQPDRQVELAGVDGTLVALRPALERCQAAPDESAWARLLHASHQSVRNEAMAQAYKHIWGHRLLAQFEQDGGLFEHFARPHVSAYRLFNRLAAFDARSVTPFSKMKLDLSVDDVLSHSPEFTQTVRLHLCAIRRRAACLRLAAQFGDDADTAFDTLFPGLLPRWVQGLAARGFAADQFYPLPLHPLNVPWVRAHLSNLLEQGDLVLLDGMEMEAAPSLSFRSMLMSAQCLKVPVPMQTTHLIRDVAVREIDLGPLCSDILQRVVDEEALGQRLVLERDLLGLYADPALPGLHTDLAAMLGFVSRQNPDAQIRAGEKVLPAAGLFSVVPGRPWPFFVDIVEQRRRLCGQSAMAYFADLVRLVVGTQLDLYFRAGLMLEAHQQNLNIVFGPDWDLRYLMYHDIPGGVAAFTPLLRARYDAPESLSRLFYFRDTPERSVFQFVHPTLTSHLGPLTFMLARELKLDRPAMIRLIREEVEAAVRRGRALAARSPAEAALREQMIDAFQSIVLDSATLPGKMMLGRLYLQSLNADWGRKVPNPELLSARVLIPPCDLRNFLNSDAAA